MSKRALRGWPARHRPLGAEGTDGDRPGRLPTRRLRGEGGSAVAEFVLVMLVLLPLFMGIFQLGLFLHMRNTMTACAHEGARVAANYDAEPGDGKNWTDDCIEETSSGGWVNDVRETRDNATGLVVMTIDAHMPWLGIWGEGFDFFPTGHAVQEPDPT